MRTVTSLCVLFSVSCGCSPTVHKLRYGVTISDHTGVLNKDEAYCAIGALIALEPRAAVALDGVTMMVTEFKQECGKLKTAGGCYVCGSNWGWVWDSQDGCFSDSPLIHELVHVLQEKLDGLCDAEHSDMKYWDLYNGLNVEATMKARAECCPDFRSAE